MGKYDFIIWDLDGTLLDTLNDLANSVNAALEAYGCPGRTIDEVRSFVGNGIRRLMELAVPHGLSSPDFDGIFAFFRQHYKKTCLDTTKPYSGIDEVLHKLQMQGVRMAIVSNKADYAVAELAEMFFAGTVPVAIGEREGTPRKPAPDMVFNAMKLLGADATRTVYIGDSEVDLMTARNAGLECISAAWGFRSRAELLRAGAGTIADAPPDILKLM